MKTTATISNITTGAEPEDEVRILTAVAALYTMNDAPGQHIITIPKDPKGRWEYEFKEATI